MSKPTLKDIANRLNVSTATVSLALRKSPKISGAVTNSVELMADEIGYILQRGAANLRTDKTQTIGVAINNLMDPFYSMLLAALNDTFEQNGRTIFLCDTNESVDRQTHFIRKMAEYNADGIILCPAIGTTVLCSVGIILQRVPR